jgi:hypothetical protein
LGVAPKNEGGGRTEERQWEGQRGAVSERPATYDARV